MTKIDYREVSKSLTNAGIMVLVFVLMQGAMTVLVGVEEMLRTGITLEAYFSGGFSAPHLLVAIQVLSGLLTLIVFHWRRWGRVDRAWLRTRPWSAMCWTALVPLGLILPVIYLGEQVGTEMGQSAEYLIKQLMASPIGYLAIAIFAPVVEEVVFRGGVLRVLLRGSEGRWPWLWVVVTSALFALVHGNSAQGLTAFLIGLFMGWLYYRSQSVVPGIIYHWVNNSVAYIAMKFYPTLSEMKLQDIFGSEQHVWLALFFSACIAVPSLFQLISRLKAAEEVTTN